MSFGNEVRELIKYDLNRDKILEFFHWNLEELNVLSEEVLKQTPFDEGEFYTLMPKGLTQKQLHDFRGGCVERHGIQEGVCDFIYKKQKSNSSYFCMFDDFTEDYKEEFYKMNDFFGNVAMHFQKKEVYLLLMKNQINTDSLQDCFQLSDCIWHSLMIMSDIPFEKNHDKEVSKQQLGDIAKNAKLVVLRAYDQEGYVFWEKNDDKL